MGVYGLTKLFYGKKASARNGGGWVRKSIQGPLVVDGNQFCHQTCDFLTNVKHPRSGSPTNYAMFFEYVTKILHKFKRCGIEPYFIFDGVDKRKKLSSEYRKRAVSKNSIPTLVYTVFFNALREMEVKMYVADGEGDVTCAEVANFFKCPVLSFDSDFFLFDIPGGYIDFKTCLSENIFDSDSATLKAEIYYRKEFVNYHFSSDNNDLIFLYPAIIGNGINPPTGNLIDNRKRWSVDAVERFVFAGHSTIASLPEGVRKNFDDVKEYYNGLNPLDPQIMLTAPIPKCSKQVPEWFQMSYRTRAMPLMPYDVLVNGMQHHGSSAIPERIRQCCYTILGIPEVTEYRSTPGGVEEQQIKCLEEIPGCLALEEVESEDDSKKKTVLYFAMECERQAAELDNLSSEGDRFFMCTVIFWMSKTAPPNNLVKALLACFIHLSNKPERQESVHLHRQTGLFQSARSGNQLVLKEWQCVYQDALILFFLLRYSPQTAPCPSRIFDENIILSLASNGPSVIDDAILEFIEDEHLLKKYRNMTQILWH